MDDRSIARWRMHTLRLAGQTYPSPAVAVEGLLGVQAENHAQALWAVASRTPRTTDTEIGRLFDEGAFLRTHVLRSTWHYVSPDDIRWLVELTAPRVRPTYQRLQQELGLSDATIDRSTEAIVEALSGGVHLTRAALGQRLRALGLPAEGQRLGVMMASAEMAGLVCSGVMEGRHHTYALLEDRAPHARRLDRDEALVRLALRYFAGHGPATERDLSYWATMTVTDVRAGLAEVADQLDRVEYDGRTYWFREPPPDSGPLSPRAHLLQVLDEYHNGYQDSRYVLDAEGLLPRRRGATMGMTLLDGQIVGDMRRTIRGARVTFEVDLLRELARGEREELDGAGQRYGQFLGRDAEVVINGPGPS